WYESRDGQPVTDGPQVLEAFTEFLTGRGIHVTNPATGERLRRFMELNIAYGAACTVANWFQSLERLYAISSEFRKGVTGYTPAAAPVVDQVAPLPETEADRQKRLLDAIENGRNTE